MNENYQYRIFRHHLKSDVAFLKDKEYLSWVKERYPAYDIHHILGSVIGKKFTDYLVHPVKHEEHLNKVEFNKAYYFDLFLEPAIRLLEKYRDEILGFELPVYDITPESVRVLILRIANKKLESL